MRRLALSCSSFSIAALMMIALACGWTIGASTNTNGELDLTTIPATKLHATATHSDESMSIATGMILDGNEGVFFLDRANGDLRALLLNAAGGVAATTQFNVLDDLRVDVEKSPRLLMITGRANLSRGAAPASPAQCVIYVVNSASGRYAAYSFWIRKATLGTRPRQSLQVRKLQLGEARNMTLIRDRDAGQR